MNCHRHALGLPQASGSGQQNSIYLQAAHPKGKQIKTCSESRTNAMRTLTQSLSHTITQFPTQTLTLSLSNRFGSALARSLFTRRERISLHVSTANTGEIQAAFAFELRTAKGHTRAVLLRNAFYVKFSNWFSAGREGVRGQGKKSGVQACNCCRKLK